jgi:hypothetical protein
MIGQSFLRRSLAAQSKYGAMVNMSTRAFAGGAKKPKPIDPSTTEFDLVLVGKFPFPTDA